MRKKPKYYMAMFLLIALIILLVFIVPGINWLKYDIRISFRIEGCFNSRGKLVVKGTVILENNTDSPLFFEGESLAENVDFVVVDNFFGKSQTANGNLMYSISFDLENKKTYRLKVTPRGHSESDFLTAFDGELQALSIRRIYCRAKIDNEIYCSPVEILRLKE